MSKSQFAILVFTFICFIVWLVADLVRTKASITVSPELQQALEPINPTFDKATLDAIANIQPVPANTFKPTPIPSPSPTTSPTVIPLATPLIATPSAITLPNPTP